MDKIGAYSAYQKTYTDSLVNRKETTRKKESAPVKEAEKTQSAEKVNLSNKAKELLASELTSMVHSKEDADAALATAKALVGAGNDIENMPSTDIPADLLNND